MPRRWLSRPPLMACSAYRMAMDGFPANSPPAQRAWFINSAAGTLDSQAHRERLPGGDRRAVKIISIAFVLPTRRASRCVPANRG